MEEYRKLQKNEKYVIRWKDTNEIITTSKDYYIALWWVTKGIKNNKAFITIEKEAH